MSGCPYCGAPVEGYEACLDNTHILSSLLDHNIPEQYLAKFPGVDAMALQHPEHIDEWTVYFHLARLKLMFDNGIKWQYAFSPILSNVLNKWKYDRVPVLSVPAPLQRGSLNSQGLVSLSTVEEASEYSMAWGKSVYDSYQCDSVLVYPIAKLFLEQID